MYQDAWQAIVHFVSVWGSNLLVVFFAGVLVTLIGVFFRRITSFISFLFRSIRSIFSKRGRDDAFERAYLNWIIDKHRYLGLLPAWLVAARWGEGRRVVDLEKVYVTLQISEQPGDQNWSESSRRDSWRKPPWWYPILKETRLFTLFSVALFLIVFLFAIIFGLFYAKYFTTLKNSHAALTQILLSDPYILLYGIIISILLLINSCLLILRRRVLRGEQGNTSGDLAQAIDNHQRLVLRGDPGSGKTTLLRYLAVTCARARRKNKKQGDIAGLVRERLLWTVRPFPLLVTLRLRNDVLYWSDNKRFIDTFHEEMPEELRKRCPDGFFERKLTGGDCLILLDAFDELGSVDARSLMTHRLGDFLLTHAHPRNRVIVTTRVIGYEGQLDQYDFQIRTVQRLRTGEIRALIKQRYRAMALSETAGWRSFDAEPVVQEMRTRSEHLIKKIESTPRLAQLATNPLLLSLIVLVHRVKVELPEGRILLYRDCVEILTEQWQRSNEG